jgi:hypothetical protein
MHTWSPDWRRVITVDIVIQDDGKGLGRAGPLCPSPHPMHVVGQHVRPRDSNVCRSTHVWVRV